MSGSGLQGTVCAVLLTASLLLVGASALADEVEDPSGTVCVGIDADADCDNVAASPTGDASCAQEIWIGPPVMEPVSCIALTAEGDARCYARGCVAASGTGNASGERARLVVSGTGNASDAMLAVSVTGDAEGGFAASGTGDSDGGLLAVSGTGNTSSRFAEISGTDDSDGVALSISGTGDAGDSVVAVSGTGDAEGCMAIAGTGQAHSDCSAQGQPLEVSGCETGQSAGTDAACQDAP